MVHAGLTLETCVERTATVGRVATRRGQSGNPSILVIVKDEAGWLAVQKAHRAWLALCSGASWGKEKATAKPPPW